MNLRVPKTIRYSDLMGFKYTKADLERIVSRQLENLEVLGERVKLLEKQNELLVKYNHKLIEKLSDRKTTNLLLTMQKSIQAINQALGKKSSSLN